MMCVTVCVGTVKQRADAVRGEIERAFARHVKVHWTRASGSPVAIRPAHMQ